MHAIAVSTISTLERVDGASGRRTEREREGERERESEMGLKRPGG